MNGGEMLNMKKNGYILTLAGLILFAIIAARPAVFALGVSAGLKSCAEVIIPSLFGFTAASGLLGSGELPERFKKIISVPMKFLFGLSGESFPALILGLFGGYPTVATATRALLGSGKISKSEAKKLTAFCLSPGIGFCVNAVGGAMLSSRRAGAVILASICISVLPLGFIAKHMIKSDFDMPSPSCNTADFSQALVGSVTACANAMLSICAFVSLFSGLTACAEAIIPNENVRRAVTMLCEVTNGCISCAGTVPLEILCAECAFGGLCIHMQIFALCGEATPCKKIFFLFRILHAVFSATVCRLLLTLFPVSQATLATVGESHLWSHSAPASISLLFLSALLILDLDTKRKKC